MTNTPKSILYARLQDLEPSPTPLPSRDHRTALDMDDVDAIEVIEGSIQAIPIAATLLKPSRRHDGSHGSARRFGSLAQRHLEKDLDLIHSDSSDIDAEVGSDTGNTGRGRRRHPSRGGLRLASTDDDDQIHSSSRHRSAGPVRLRSWQPRGHLPLSMYAIKDAGSEQDAVVFENFEDTLTPSPVDETSKNPYENQLHFVRNASSICISPGAGLAFTSTPSVDDDFSSANKEDTQTPQHPRRERHLRRTSEPLQEWGSFQNGALRATRRRATVGSDALYRQPALS